MFDKSINYVNSKIIYKIHLIIYIINDQYVIQCLRSLLYFLVKIE